MTHKHGGNETSSGRFFDWITRIVTLITILAGILGIFLPEEKYADKIAWSIFIPLVIVSTIIYSYRYSREKKLKIEEVLKPLARTAALRGLLPFEEGDELPGRGRDVLDLFTLLSSSTFRFGVLWGESGCGKTSLLRAGLIPRLQNEKFLPLYISKPTNSPQEAIRSAFLKEAASLGKQTNKSLNLLIKSAVSKDKKVVVIFDQFEEFFLTNRTPKLRASFIQWLGETIADQSVPMVFLLSIRGDIFAQLQNFAPQIPEPTSSRTTYQLQNFDTEQAKQIFSTAAKDDGIPFEPELIQGVIRELESEEFIRPAELQVVGTRLKRKNITRLNQYETLGGARGILSSYISDEIKQSPNEHMARLVLRLMCSDAVGTRSPNDLSLSDLMRGISGTGETISSIRPELIQVILNQFVLARIVIHTDEDKYNLVHDYLASYVRTATEGVETNMERANRLLKRYVAEYKEDQKTRIPFLRARWIQKYASAEAKNREKAQELIKKSERNFYGRVVALAMPVITLLGLYFFYLTSAYYLSIDNSYIVLRAGLPQFTFLPGFGKVIIQTDLKREDLIDDQTRNQIDQGKVSGFLYQQAERGYHLWGDQSLERIEVLTHVQMLRWLGRLDNAHDLSINTISDPQADQGVRSSAANALGSLAQANPEAVTSNMLAELITIVTNRDAHRELRSSAANALDSLAQANPEAVTSDMLPKLIDTVTERRASEDVHSPAVDALGSLAQANPEAVTSDMLAELIEMQAGSFVRSLAVDALGSLAQANPEAVTSDMLPKLITIVTDSEARLTLRYHAVNALGSLAQANPEAITAEMLQSLFAQLRSYTDSPGRNTAAYALFSIAFSDPKQEKTILQELMVLSNSPKPHWRIAANRTLEMLEIGNLVGEARTHPDQIESIRSRLNYLVSLDESLNEQHLQFVAQIVMQEIAQIEEENKN